MLLCITLLNIKLVNTQTIDIRKYGEIIYGDTHLHDQNSRRTLKIPSAVAPHDSFLIISKEYSDEIISSRSLCENAGKLQHARLA